MRSTANLKGHPLHPMLIPFPIAFFTGAFVSDLAAIYYNSISWSFIASRLAVAGIVMALVAAIPGLIDYVATVPPKSTGKQRATKHMLINIAVVVLFFIGSQTRESSSMPQMLTLGLELVGFGLLCIAGWMGGTLAYRNQIGVDHRYAGAGKWNEASLTGSAGQQVTVATLDELKVDQMKLVEVAGKRIVIGRSESGLVAFDDRCSHRGASLADGVMICGTVQCPWHGSQFDCATGNVKAGPAKEKIALYTILQKNNEIVLQL